MNGVRLRNKKNAATKLSDLVITIYPIHVSQCARVLLHTVRCVCVSLKYLGARRPVLCKSLYIQPEKKLRSEKWQSYDVFFSYSGL